MKTVIITGAPWVERLAEALQKADAETVIVVDNVVIRYMALEAAGLLEKDVTIKVKGD